MALMPINWPKVLAKQLKAKPTCRINLRFVPNSIVYAALQYKHVSYMLKSKHNKTITGKYPDTCSIIITSLTTRL